MDNINKEVVLRLKLDPSDLEKKSAILEKNLTDIKQQIADVNKELKRKDIGNEEREKLAKQLVELKRQQREFSVELRNTNKEIDNNNKIVKENVGSNNQLRALLSSLTAEYNALGVQQRENSERGQFLKTTIRAISDELKANESAVGDNRRNVGNYVGAIELLIDALEKENASLSESNVSLQKTATAQIGFIKNTEQSANEVNNVTNSLNGENSSLEAVNQQIVNNNQQIANNNKQLEELRTVVRGFTQNTVESSDAVENYSNTLEGLNKKIADLQARQQTLDLGSEEYKNITEEIIRTRGEIDKAIGKVDEFGNREPKNPVKKAYDDAFESASALTESIALLSVAFSDSESIQQLQERTLKAVAVAQTVYNISKSRGAIADTIANAKMLVLTTTQKIYTAVVGTSTGALKAFKIALATTGIGAVVVGLGLLIERLTRSKDETKKLTDEQQKYADNIKQINENSTTEIITANRLFETLKNTNSGSKLRSELITEINSKYGLTLKNLKDETAFLNAVEIAQARVVKGLQLKLRAQLVEAELLEALKQQREAGKKLTEAEIELADALASGDKKRVEEANKKLEATNKQIEATYKLTTAQSELDEEIKADTEIVGDYTNALNGNTTQTDKALNSYENSTKKVNTLSKELAGLEGQYKSLIDENKKNTKESESSIDKITEFIKKTATETAEITNEIRDESLQKELDALEISQKNKKDQLENDLKNIKATTDAEKKLKQQAQKELANLLVKIDEETNAKRQQIINKFAQEDVKEIEDSFDQKITLLQAEADKRKELIDLNVKNEREKQRQILQIELETAKKTLEILKAKAEVDPIVTPEETAEIVNAQNQIDILTNKVKNLNDEAGQPLIPQDTKEKIDLAIEGITTAIGILSDAINQGYENQAKALEQSTQKQIEAINETTLTEKQKQKQIEQINIEAQKRKYELEVEAFNFNKGMQIAQAVISGAQAIVNILSTPGDPFGIATAIRTTLAVATTSAQIGIISAQQPPPPPQFYEGGYTGDGNPRDVSTKLGRKNYIYHKNEYIVPSKVLNTSEGSELVSRLESMRINKFSSLGLTGFADGGFTTNSIKATAENSLMMSQLSQNIADALSNVKIVTRVTDINRVNRQMTQTRIASTLR